MIPIYFYNNVNASLRNFISHYWYVHTLEETQPTYDLLPMDHVDLVIPLKGSFTYKTEEKHTTFSTTHFHGIREHSVSVTSSKEIHALGISFTPWGFQPLIKEHMKSYTNRISCLGELAPDLSKQLDDQLCLFDSNTQVSQLIENIEDIIMNNLQVSSYDLDAYNIIQTLNQNQDITLDSYCKENNLSIRKLQRIYQKYIGVSPKKYKSLTQFENVTRDILYKKPVTLTELCYEHTYYDQPHFTKSFKNYTNFSPRDFISQEPALKKHLNYNKG